MTGKILAFQPPSPPLMDIDRECAGGFGVGQPSDRDSYGHDQYPYYSVTLAFTAGALVEAGHDVAFYDAQAHRDGFETVLDKVAAIAPSWIVAVVNFPSLDADLELLAKVKQRLGAAVGVVCVGSICRVLYKEIAERDGIDYVVTGEPEKVVPSLLTARPGSESLVEGLAFKRGADVFVTPKAAPYHSLDETAPIPYQIMSMDNYQMELFGPAAKFATITSSLGCAFDCGYCPYPVGFGNRVRFRSVTGVLDEMTMLNRDFGIEEFVFRDQVFTLYRKRTVELCEGLIERGLDIRWDCETRFDNVDEELRRIMKRAGCERVHFGLETGDVQLFESLGKPGMAFERIRQSIDWVDRAGIDFHLHLIVGLPGETWQSVFNTASMLKALNIYSINPSIFVPYPGTDCFEEAKSRGWIETYDWSRYTSRQAVARTEALSARQLERAHRYLMNVFSVKEHTSRRARVLDQMKETVKAALLRSGIGLPEMRKHGK